MSSRALPGSIRRHSSRRGRKIQRSGALGLVRAGPPFPYLRWTGPPPSARSSAAARSGGSGEETSTAAPVTGCGKASRAACRNWMPDREQVRSDLVRAAGLEAHAQQRVVRQRALDLEVRDRLARLVGVGRDPSADAPVATERRVDSAAPRRRAALDEREVLAHELARRQQPLQRRVDRLGAGDDQQPRRVAVEPVHDPGALGVLPTRDPPRERLRQRPAAVPARRMHDDARGLVDHDQVLVLPRDRVRRLAHRRGGRRRAGLLHAHQLAARQRQPLRPHGAVDGHVAAVDQPLRGGARAGVRGEEDVEPLPGRLRGNRQLMRHRASGVAPRARRSAPPRRR
jgi:hypothetical protein